MQIRKLLGKFKTKSKIHMCNVNKFEIRQVVVCRINVTSDFQKYLSTN